MESVYVLESGAYLRKDGASYNVVRNGEIIDRIPAEGLKRLILVGNVSLSGGVMDNLIRNRIETVFLTSGGRFRARLALDEHRHVALRMAQYQRLGDKKVSLETARAVAAGKLSNQFHFLQLRARQYRDDDIRRAAIRIKAMADNIINMPDMETLRGLEGTAGRIYFDVFPRLLKNPDFSFNGRNRRPPLDPVNALLSFVYTLLLNEVLSAVRTAGLDPYLGALHEISYGRPSLACDLVEEYRSFLGDRLILGLINRKAIRKDDFLYRSNSPAEYIDEEEMKQKRPVEMKPAVGRVFIAAYEEMMKGVVHHPVRDQKMTYRWLIQQQVYSFARYLEGEEETYQPFSWKV